MTRMPTLFIPHGGGPCFFMEWYPPDTWDRHRSFLEGIVKLSAFVATKARHRVSNSLQLTRDIVPDPMGVGSSLTVGCG